MNKKELNQKVVRLQELIQKGHVQFERPSAITDSLDKIGYDQKGQVDPKTVDKNVKALLLVVEMY
ncbi:hypothetical protein GXN76_12785 [Kroppenstedtia pulmonis]|uniref:Uncharacterized protein n=1 Tax=Kroppenstedtia pulmonis TaxID=1380685 RepID=A0A7D3XJN1_9BACL|nr:hypothetical protein [Kroppenstedtia pulmonis]QKG85264.1 hypothetical protein GXN76_12785 [Kroppenstedtia pulmonis]